MSVIEDFQQVFALIFVEGGQSPIVKNDEMGTCEFIEEFGVSAIGPGDIEFGEQSGESEVQDGMALAAGLMCECAGDEGFTDTTRAGDQYVQFIVDPLAGGELSD